MQEQDKPTGVTRDHLVARLAEVSHETYMRQAKRDKGRDEDPDVTDHDRERAEDSVRELERLGVFGEGRTPEPGEPVGFTVMETGESAEPDEREGEER